METSVEHGARAASERFSLQSALREREVGRVTGGADGPTLIVVAGIHGNEPAGYEAAWRVLRRLSDKDIAVRGELVVIAGNTVAASRGLRYVDKDLNRAWSAASIAAQRARDPRALDSEDHEQRDMLEALDAAFARARGPVHLADLHTSSAPGIPFVLFGDTLAQRRFVRAFPIPIIIGLEEQVDGVLSQYGTRRGAISFAVEGGQHDDPAARDSLEAIVWIALARAGVIARDACPEIARSVKLLDERRAGLPRVLEVIARRAIEERDDFVMAPGFRNLARVRSGQLLARDRAGEIRAASDGVVILPLYQKLGDDGFFWGRAISERHMRWVERLRALPLERHLDRLPGIARDPEDPARFVVDARAARLYALDVLRLFGYRRQHARGAAVVVEK